MENFFQDGTQIDLTSDLPRMLQQLQELAPEDIEGFFDYLSYANKMYESNLKSFYKKVYLDFTIYERCTR